MNIGVVVDDVLRWSSQYRGPKFHALLTDPPYHLTSITKRFGKPGSAPAKYGRDGAFSRASAGFMGQQWDGGDTAFDPGTWAAIGEHLLPGAFGMSFASSRGWHRLAVAIEDAGFIIHPSIFGWLYGSGFPKATRVKGRKDFDGHRYGLQALKPALEPIIVFQKPYEGKPIECITETGAGTLNIDSARIPTDEAYTVNTWDDGAHPFGDGAGNPYTSRQESGRWPANFVLDEKAAKRMGEDARFFFTFQQSAIDDTDQVRYQAKASRDERDAGLDHFPEKHRVVEDGERTDNTLKGPGNSLHPDKNVKLRNIHPTVKPIELNRWLATLLLPPREYAPRRILIPFAGSGSEMIGAGLAGWEEILGIEKSEEYGEIARARIEYWLNQPRQLGIWG